MRKIAMFFGVLFALAMLGSASAQDSVTVNLNAIGSSGISGSAVFSPVGTNQTQIVVTLTGGPAGASEPIHIHTGQCGTTLGGVKYPLKNVENGTSTTTINAAFVPLWTGGFAINAHESAANIKNYIACGNLPNMTTAQAAMPKAGGTPGLAIAMVAVRFLLAAGYVLRRRTA